MLKVVNYLKICIKASECMKVSVIIPFRNYNISVRNCIESVKTQKYKNVEIIAVSNKIKVKEIGVKSIFAPRCKGPGEKRNSGASVAKGDILFFLDSDCVLKANSIQNLVKTFKEQKTDAVTGKPLAPRKGNLLGTVTGWEYEDRFDQMGECFVDVAATTCFGVLKKPFNITGGFIDYSQNEAIGEDWDFSTRFRRKGYKIYHTNKVEVYHEHISEKLSDWFKKRILHAKYRITHLKKYEKFTDQYSGLSMIVSSSFLLSLPIVIRVFRKKKDSRVFVLPFFAFLRTIAWSIGTVLGFIRG